MSNRYLLTNETSSGTSLVGEISFQGHEEVIAAFGKSKWCSKDDPNYACYVFKDTVTGNIMTLYSETRFGESGTYHIGAYADVAYDVQAFKEFLCDAIV